MTKIIVALVILVLLVVAAKVFEEFTHSRRPQFQYRRKDGVMTEAERECYNALVSEMGPDYYFFPQMHLDAIVQPTDIRKDRFYAFRHINQKSVDFVACDKKQLRPLFAIELDDKTHNQPNRMKRDEEVERILRGAGIPLIRIQNRGRFEPKTLAAEVQRGMDVFYAKPRGFRQNKFGLCPITTTISKCVRKHRSCCARRMLFQPMNQRVF